MKSRTAFEFTVRKMLRETGRLYFWTFTFRDVHSFRIATSLWNELLTMLKRKLHFRGVRVLELHEEHGVHFHVLANRRFRIRSILSFTERYGFGRIGVDYVEDADGAVKYLCKYLSKRRPRCLKGARLWAAFGEVPRTRVADVLIDSPFGRLLRRAMGTVSPDEELHGVVRAATNPDERSPKQRFLNAVHDAQEAYWQTFDPRHAERQSLWGQLRFHGQCGISPQWYGSLPIDSEEDL